MELYHRYGPALLRKAERMLQSREEAQDLVQGLFLDLLQRPPAASAGAIDLPYLYRAITNRCLNQLRDHRNRGRLLASHQLAAGGIARTRVDDQIVDRQILSNLSGQLDDQSWEVLVYRFVDDLGEDEIASLMGASRRTVARRLRHIRDQVRRLAGEARPAVADGKTGAAP